MKKRNFLLILLSVIMATALAIPAFAVFADTSDAIYVFSNGVYDGTFGGGTSNEVATLDSGNKVWRAAGNYSNNRLLLTNKIDLSEFEDSCLSITYSTTDCAWSSAEVRILNAVGAYGDFMWSKYSLTVVTDGSIQVITIPISSFALHDKTFWGNDVTEPFDKTAISGVAFNFSGTIDISEIKFISIQNIPLIEKETTPTNDSDWNYELHITNTNKINVDDTLVFTFKGAFVDGSGAVVAKAYSIYVGENLVTSGVAPTPSSATDSVTISYTFTESYAAADIYFRYQYGNANPCTSVILKRAGSEDSKTKKLNFYDENGEIMSELSNVDYSTAEESTLPEYTSDNKLVLGWRIGDELYRAGGKVSAEVINANDSAYAVAIDFKTLSGAYFRIGETAGVSGIRFDTTFNSSDYEVVKNFVSEFGTLILPTETLNGKEITLDNFTVDKDILKVKCTSDVANNTYYGAIFSLKEANYNRDFSARGYITVKYSDNTTETYYSGVVANSSVAYMADYYKQNKSDEYNKLTDAQKKIVDAYAAAYTQA